jgi:3-hydroxyisobutyrate dehydrogenase-like beta-hydroxyacid dehydrogenase
VLSVNSAGAALDAAQACAPFLREAALFADLNSASPRVKVAVANAVASHGALFADVALMAPVPGRGLRTPMLVSGDGAETFVRLFGALGTPVEIVGEAPGIAAERKLLRSVFMKGMAAAALESLHAAEAAGCEEWLHGELASILASADASVLDRLVDGSRKHAARREDEMLAACELLRGLGVEPHIAEGARAVLADLRERTRTP